MAKSEKEVTEQERFVIEDDDQADWALRKIRHLKQMQQEKEEFAQKRIDKIQEELNQVEHWRDKQVAKFQEKIEYFEGLLTQYAMKLKEEDEDLKSHSLPFGELKFRKQRAKTNYDNEKLLKFLEENDIDAIRVKKSPDKRKLKKMAVRSGDKLVIEDLGVVVEGVQIQERGEKFSIDVEGVD